MFGDYQDWKHYIHVQSENRAIRLDAKKPVHDSLRIEADFRGSVFALPVFRRQTLRRTNNAATKTRIVPVLCLWMAAQATPMAGSHEVLLLHATESPGKRDRFRVSGSPIEVPLYRCLQYGSTVC